MKNKTIITLMRVLRRAAMQLVALEKFRSPRPVAPPSGPPKLRLRKRRLSVRSTNDPQR